MGNSEMSSETFNKDTKSLAKVGQHLVGEGATSPRQLLPFMTNEAPWLRKGPLPEVRLPHLSDDEGLRVFRRPRNSSLDSEEFMREQVTSAWT